MPTLDCRFMSAIWREDGPWRTFPFGENQRFLRADEEVILRLLCISEQDLADMDPAHLHAASGGRIACARADEIVRTARLARLPGLGSWAARLLAEAGLDEADVRRLPAAEIAARVHARYGYRIWNEKAVAQLTALQVRWREEA